MSAPRVKIIDEFPKPLFSAGPKWVSQNAFHPQVVTRCRAAGDLSDQNVKVIMLGEAGVGKTAFVTRFCQGLFDSNYKATIGVDFFVEKYEILGKPFRINIWDTAGQERFRSVAEGYYRSCQIVVVAFDMSQPETLDFVPQWIKAVEESTDKPFDKFVIGLKRDLCSGPFSEVVTRNGQAMATKIGAEYWEASSKTNVNVSEFFTRIAALAFDASVQRQLDSPEKTSISAKPLAVTGQPHRTSDAAPKQGCC